MSKKQATLFQSWGAASSSRAKPSTSGASASRTGANGGGATIDLCNDGFGDDVDDDALLAMAMQESLKESNPGT